MVTSERSSFRYVNDDKSLAVSDPAPFSNPLFLINLREKDFHIVTVVPPKVLFRKPRAVKRQTTDISGLDEFSSFYAGENRHPEQVHRIINAIDSLLQRGKKVVIVCGAGQETSATIAGTYLVLKKEMSVSDAAHRVASNTFFQKSIEQNIHSNVGKYRLQNVRTKPSPTDRLRDVVVKGLKRIRRK